LFRFFASPVEQQALNLPVGQDRVGIAAIGRKQGQGSQARGMIDGSLLRDHAPHRKTQHMSLVDTSGIHHADDIACHLWNAMDRRVAWHLSLPNPAIIKHDHAEVAREARRKSKPECRAAPQPHDQDDRIALPDFVPEEASAARVNERHQTARSCT
jgi:hypothetical protein